MALCLTLGLVAGLARAQPLDGGVVPATTPVPNDRGSSEGVKRAAAWSGGRVHKVRVGYTGSAPFVSPGQGKPSGLSIDIWRAVAGEVGLETSWESFDSIAALLDAVAAGRLDVGVGPISVTGQRAAHVDFTQPYFSARLGILSVASSVRSDRLRPFYSRAFLYGVGTLTLVLLFVGTLVWLFERARNSAQFPKHPAQGIPEGMWFALVTMTTVGYGDRAPVTGSGRIVAGIWMLFAMVAASSITAGIATALTLSQIGDRGLSSLDEVGGRRVAVVRGTPSQALVARRGAHAVPVATLDAGVVAVTAGHAKALLYDLPVLDRYVQGHPDLNLVVHATAERADDYAFVVQVEASLRRLLDGAVLRLRERRAIAQMASRWSVRD